LNLADDDTESIDEIREENLAFVLRFGLHVKEFSEGGGRKNVFQEAARNHTIG
jgi:hypothetical protein